MGLFLFACEGRNMLSATGNIRGFNFMWPILLFWCFDLVGRAHFFVWLMFEMFTQWIRLEFSCLAVTSLSILIFLFYGITLSLMLYLSIYMYPSGFAFSTRKTVFKINLSCQPCRGYYLIAFIFIPSGCRK